MDIGFKKIVFCTDFSDGANVAFKYALKAAVTNRAKLYILHVLPEPDAQFWRGYVVEDDKDLEAKARKDLHEKVSVEYLSKIPEGVEVETVYPVGNAAHQILDFVKAREVSLVIMGRPRQRLLRSLLYGSIASVVARSVSCPILIVPN